MAGRPKGSTNAFSKKQVEEMQLKIEELEKQYNSYDQVVDSFVDGFILELTQQIKTIDMTTLQRWFSNPDNYIQEINNLLTYYYIIDGNISQLYDLIFSLPELNYKIKTYKRLSSYENDISTIKIALERIVKHKTLTRELLVQMAVNGSVLGTWLGNKQEPYFNVFDDLDYIYPYGIYKGKMVGVFDLSYIDTLTSEQKIALYNTLKPLVTESIYNKWKGERDPNKQRELQLVVLPPETSLVARTRVLSRNQRLGLPWGTQSIFDLQHKQKMKDLERAMADKIIRAIAIVKMRDKDDNDNKVKESVQKKVFTKVKKALEQNNNSKNGLTCIAMPSFADFSYPEFKGADDILDPKKYDSVNNDITTGTTVGSVLANGSGGNYASANLNLDMIYQKIGAMLEQVEEIYNQLILIVLGKNKGSNYYFEYSKQKPLTKKEKLDNLKSLVDKGYALRPLIEEMGYDFESYIDESIYEIEKLKLRDKIIPPLSTYTATGSDVNSGRPTDTTGENNSTVQTKEQGGNFNPKPSTE
ncbi:hypothetical protein [Clostridium beijerinckii]|uniref:hypothetical protein n=1 Tax=Clostridium beijerinckii TaxID=1520 RepID=UPI00156E7B74|nr:hypothetical protein [Clostridium beijerinckii]NRU52554.1 hypothetical protein [Clostridium beijerinckii]NYC69269.1 hypothetical protein [Clostridium beijerinckii]NYC91755.1 hypothetical protein [Clostridium beijerinckii]